MRYWIGLLIALVFDAAVIAGPDSRASEAQPAVCAEQETPDAAIGCLAREIQLDPYRRDLWVALDRAIERALTCSEDIASGNATVAASQWPARRQRCISLG